MSIVKSWNGGTVTVPERTNKAWGDYTTDALVKVIDGAIADADVVDDLTTGGSTKVLSAEQGKTLKNQVDTKQEAATAVTEASAAAGAGNVMVSAGADRSIQDSGVAFSGVARGSSLTADNVITGNGTNAVKDSGVAVANVVKNTTGNSAAIGNVIVAAATDKTVKDSGTALANIPTMAANGGVGELLHTSAADKAISTSGKSLEDTPTNSTSKICTSQWLYRQSGQDTTWWARTTSTSDVTPTNSTTSNQWHPTTISVASLPAGTYEIYVKAGLYAVATAVDQVIIGVSDENADNVTPTFTESISRNFFKPAGTEMLATLSCKFRATLSVTKTIYLKCFCVGSTISSLTVKGTLVTTILEARRIY